MRKSVAVVAGAAAALAVTAAAASALALTGPTNPLYGESDALDCPMTFTVTAVTGGTAGDEITGIKVTPADYSSTECAGQTVYVKVDTIEDELGTPTPEVWYMSSETTAFASGAVTYTLGAGGTVFYETGATNHVLVQDIDDTGVYDATGLVITTGETPLNF